MFNPFFRSFLPGFRVEPDGVPGFNLDDNGLPRRTNASFDGTFPDSATQQYSDAAQTQSPPSISFRLPGAEGWVLSTPLPGFRVSPQDDVPGFNVGPQNDVPGFNVDENGVQQQQTTFGRPPGSVTPQEPNTAQTATPPPYDEEPAPPAPPPLPEWFYQRGTMLPPRLPPAFDPGTRPRLEINSLPSIGPAMMPGAAPWPPSIAPQPPPGIDIRSRVATTQNANLQPAAQQAIPPPGSNHRRAACRMPKPAVRRQSNRYRCSPIGRRSRECRRLYSVLGRLRFARLRRETLVWQGLTLSPTRSSPSSSKRTDS